MFIYYFNLFFKKTRLKIHDTFEKRYLVNSDPSLNHFQFILWKNVISNLKHTSKGTYFHTKVTNNGKPLILTQVRVLLSLVESFKSKNSILYSKYLISDIAKYIKNQRNREGLYTFNYPIWDKQDEGIATVWSLLALIKANSVLENKNIQEFVIETTHIMLDKLYSEKTSLVHTKNQNFWCLNSASTLAYLCSLLMEFEYAERFQTAMNSSISLCSNNIDVDGHFPYSEKRRGTYLLLYHPIVIYTLQECLNSKFIIDEVKLALEVKLEMARQFLFKQMDQNFYFIEPEVTKYYRYIISNITSLVAMHSYLDKETKLKILKNILKYLTNDKLFLCIDKKNRLYNSSLFDLRDQLSVEVLFWLNIYTSFDK